MARTAIAAVCREVGISPGREEADAQALSRVVDRLPGRVARVRAEELVEPPAADIVLSMARSTRALNVLARSGAWIVNAPEAVLGCRPGALHEALAAAGVPRARTEAVPVACLADRIADRPMPVRVRRADARTSDPDDRVRITAARQVRVLQTRWLMRGLREAVVQEEVGPELRFYAIPAAGFFHGDPALRPLMEQVGRATGLDIFGGRAAWAAAGPVVLDVDDWPSFTPCRDEAAEAIARLVTEGRRAIQAA